jgi:hypothetical protein
LGSVGSTVENRVGHPAPHRPANEPSLLVTGPVLPFGYGQAEIDEPSISRGIPRLDAVPSSEAVEYVKRVATTGQGQDSQIDTTTPAKLILGPPERPSDIVETEQLRLIFTYG